MSSSSLTFEFPVRNSWPVGFGFRPTEEELITHYLHNKMLGNESHVQSIREVDLHSYEPHQLPRLSIFESDNHEWFFFRAESDLYHYTDTKTKTKTKRATPTGSWKSSGNDKPIKARGTDKTIGYRKILVFNEGENVRTNWIIHEYRLHLQLHSPYQRSFVVCRLKEVSSFDDDQQNNSVSSRPKRKARRTGIQEVYSDSLLMQPEPIAHDNNPTHTEMLKCLEGELLADATSNYYDAFSEEQVEKKVNELRLCCGISVDTKNVAAFNFQNNDIYSSWYDDLESLGEHMPTIKESRRGHLPVKRVQYKLKEEDVDELHGGSSSVSSESGISMNSDVSDDGSTTFKPPNDLVPTSNRYKPKEDEKRIKVASPTSQLSITESSNGRKSEGGNKYGCVGSKGRGFSCILTTKQIHHKSSVPFVYAAKAFLGIIMFFLFVQEMLLYGSW